MQLTNLTPTIIKNRKRILESATHCFLLNGIGETTIKMIAEQAGMSIKTIFNYYQNKDMIALDLQMELLKKYGTGMNFVQFKGDTPLEKIEFFLDIFISLNPEQITAIKYITAFDYYYVRGYPSKEYGEFINDFMKPFYFLIDLIKWGQSDGSIVSGDGYDAFTIYLTLFNAIYAYVQKYYYRSDAIAEEGFSNYMGNPKLMINLLMRGLRK